jgi:hypothetical protein
MPNLVIYNQSPYFYQIAEVVYNFFKQHLEEKINLVNCDQSHKFNNDDVYLTFIPFNKVNIHIAPPKYIVYNFEQFTTNKVWSKAYFGFLQNALFVMDYSLENLCRLFEYGINAYFLPYLPNKINAHGNLENINKDIDVLFIGNLNNKRRSWLKNLEYNKYNVEIVNDAFFEKSIELFARSKILLNVHYYDGNSILEITRIIPALTNNCIVISEQSNDEYYNNMYKNTINISNIDNLRETINNILSNYNLIKNETKNNFEKIPTELESRDISELIGFIKNIIN